MRAIFYLFGICLLGLGVSMTIVSDLGTGPWDALSVALSKRTGLTIGTVVIMVGVVITIVNALIMKGRPQWGSLITVFFTGLAIDFWMELFFVNVYINDPIFRLIVLLGGIFTLSLGIVLYLQGQFAPNPSDNFMIALNKRFGMRFMYAKLTTEVIALALAFMMSGPIGLGTFIIALFIGPIIEMLFPFINQFYHYVRRYTSPL